MANIEWYQEDEPKKYVRAGRWYKYRSSPTAEPRLYLAVMESADVLLVDATTGDVEWRFGIRSSDTNIADCELSVVEVEVDITVNPYP